MRYLITICGALLLAACQPAEDTASDAGTEATQTEAGGLAAILAAQPEDVQARYVYRNPEATLEFFGVEPGMTVVEGLPGRGWYTKILVQYLGADGTLIGANYPLDLWPYFSFGTPEFVEEMRTWPSRFPEEAKEWGGDNSAEVRAFEFGSMPAELAGTADVVFFARVLHNLANYQNKGEGEFLSTALADAYAVLKPGGVFGVVQHHARDDMSDEFADGSRGYLKKGWLIEQIEAAGFEFVAESDINANPADQPGEEDIVWRLPPSLATSRDNDELRAQMQAIGESNRMTLKFRKPE